MNNKSDSIEKMRLTPFQTIIKSLASINKLLLQLFLAIGFILTLTYCSTINFYPSGLTIADGLFFILISFTFTFYYSIIWFLLFCGGIAISPIFRKIQSFETKFDKKKSDKTHDMSLSFPSLFKNELLSFGIIGYVTLIFIVCDYFINHPERTFKLIIIVIFMGIYWGILNKKINNKSNSFSTLYPLTLIVYIIPGVFLGGGLSLLNNSMETIGVRTQSSIIQLAENHTFFLIANDIEPFLITKDNEGIFKNATVLFQGIGTNIHVKIENFSLTVPSKDIIIGKLDSKKPTENNEQNKNPHPMAPLSKSHKTKKLFYGN